MSAVPQASDPLHTSHRWRLGWAGKTALFAAGYALLAVAVWAIDAETPRANDLARQPFNSDLSGPSRDVGDAACAACHAEQVSHYHQTAHFRTSSLPTAVTVHAHFEAGQNQLRTGNPNLYFQMEAKNGEFTETAIARTSPTEVMTRTETIDVVIGSGRKGQTYLFWDEDRLCQLPVSFWTGLNQWANSPGYADGFANFERPIDARCLECHATAFASSAPPINRYQRDQMRLGISCEKCHGPGEAHVMSHQGGSQANAIPVRMMNPAKLSRERQMDLCALCHAGIGNSITPPGSFKVGDKLADHLTFQVADPSAPIDVHASQIELLEQSRCFRSNATMTCTTCHDVHQEQRDLAAMATRCLSCHQVQSCGEFKKQGLAIAVGCVDCHMPLQKTSQIISIADGQTLQPMVRNHRIAVYKKAGD